MSKLAHFHAQGQAQMEAYMVDVATKAPTHRIASPTDVPVGLAHLIGRKFSTKCDE